MRYIKDIKEGETLNGVYFCKVKNELRSKTDKLYYSLTLQDKTGVLDGKVWDPNSNGIEDFSAGDFIYIVDCLKIRQNILNFAPAVKIHAANQLIRNTVENQLFFYRS